MAPKSSDKPAPAHPAYKDMVVEVRALCWGAGSRAPAAGEAAALPPSPEAAPSPPPAPPPVLTGYQGPEGAQRLLPARPAQVDRRVGRRPRCGRPSLARGGCRAPNPAQSRPLGRREGGGQAGGSQAGPPTRPLPRRAARVDPPRPCPFPPPPRTC